MLTPVTQAVRLLQFSDPHLLEDGSGELYGVRTADTFRATLSRALVEAPGPLDAILVTGDIADDGRACTYEHFRDDMRGLGLPVLCVPGNHEHPAAMSAVLDVPPLSCGGSFDCRGWRAIMLSSHVRGADFGWLDELELERLDRELAGAHDRHALVCLHHQPVRVGSPWLDGVGLRNAESLLALAKRHRNVRAIVFGHVHQAFDSVEDGIRMLGTPSTCAQFTPRTKKCVMDVRPPGFRWLQLTAAGEIDTRVVWLDELRRTERPPDSRCEATV
jgi:Icc protein